MRLSYKTRAAAIVLAGLFPFCSTLVSQAQSSSFDRSTESSSQPAHKVVAAVQPPEIASSSPAPVPAAATEAAPAAADTKVQQNAPPVPTVVGDDKDKNSVGPSYVVGISDELQISVWKEPDLSGPVVVRPDGMITVPVVDDVYVVGMTTKQVQDMLTEKLKPVVAEPQVTVIVRNIHSRKVYLVGQVGHVGSMSLSGHETVLQILAQSGGPGIYAKSDKIYILRQMADGRQERLHFNYKKALKGTDPNADFPLKTGDVIVVP